LHDADKNTDRGPGMAPCDGSNFDKSFRHARFLA
jgi:hypothetical protein